MIKILKFNEEFGRSPEYKPSHSGKSNRNTVTELTDSEFDDLLRKIRDRIINNVGVQEYTDRESDLLVDDCMDIIKQDLKSYRISKK